MANIKSINGNPIVLDSGGLSDNAATPAKLANGIVSSYLEFDYTSTGTSGEGDYDYDLVAGVQYTVEIDRFYGSSSWCRFYAIGDAQHNVSAYATGSYTFTPASSGKLRIWAETLGTHTVGRIYAKTRFDKPISDAANRSGKPDTPSLKDVKITTLDVFSGLTVHANQGLPNDANSRIDVNNYADFLASSSVQHMSEPVRIRNNDGTLVYKNLRTVGTLSAGGKVMNLFGKDGVFLRYVTFSQFEQRTKTFLDDEYFAAFCRYPTNFPDYGWTLDPVSIEWLNGESNVYTVGTGKDFTTFTAMLVALKDDAREKTVYVDGGTYDIYEEMGGAEFIASITNPASRNWRDVCHVVPPNTTIIGRGSVTLSWRPPASVIGSNEMATLFSPLNLSGACHIENITCVCENGRYAIHDETSALAQFDGSAHEFVNVRALNMGGTYGAARQAYGGGHGKSMRYYYRNCLFQGPWQEVYLMHDAPSTAKAEGTTMSFEGCVFKSTYNGALNKHTVRLRSQDTVDREDTVTFDSCYIDEELNFDAASANKKQAYIVTLIGCNHPRFAWSDNIPTHIDPTEYNVIGL